jgi:predicted enzyme related to lactoylglutathione lyase
LPIRGRIVFQTEDGEQHGVGGQYREVLRNEKPVFTWMGRSLPEPTSLVTVSLTGRRGHSDAASRAVLRRARARSSSPGLDGRTRQAEATVRVSRGQGLHEDSARFIQPGKEHDMAQSQTTRKQARPEEREKPAHGTFYWNELMSHDVEGAKAFYATALGWTFEPMPMPDGTYWIIKCGGEKPIGGMFAMSGADFQGVPDHWMAYIAVDDVDARVAKAVAAGATICRPAFEVPGVGRIVILREPGGAAIGWITPSS